MMRKAYEGLAKKVQAEAVVKAMEQVGSRYEFATKQASAVTSEKAKINQMAAILAGSMAGGMNDGDVQRIMQVLRERTRNMAQAHSEELAMQTFMTTRTDGSTRNSIEVRGRFRMSGTAAELQCAGNA
jgi:hypothetical protein